MKKESETKVAKPRMTKEEKIFVERITRFITETPEIRNGKSYLDRKSFALLSEKTQNKFLTLIETKTR